MSKPTSPASQAEAAEAAIRAALAKGFIAALQKPEPPPRPPWHRRLRARHPLQPCRTPAFVARPADTMPHDGKA